MYNKYMNIKKAKLITFIVLVTLLANASLAFGAITEDMKGGITNSGINLPGGGDAEAKAQTIVGQLINAFISLFGVIFMILIIYGGYKWMMASGREEEVSKAKDIIKSAIIGLIIVMASYAISFFVTNALQGAIK